MEHVAIDLGGRESQVCVRASDGTVLLERRVLTSSVPAFLKKSPASRVVVETCAEAFGIADAAITLGHQVRVVPSALVRALGVGDHGMKTDQRDARNLSRASVCMLELPSVHVPSQKARERKTLAGMRDGLVKSRTMLINTVRGWMRARAERPRTGQAETFAKRVRQALGEPAPSHIERQLRTIEFLDTQILEADGELAKMAEGDADCQRLMGVPGVGPVTAIRFTAAIDEVTRFATSAQVQSYLGLTPGENSSSDRQRRTGITKAGPAALRATLIQAAWAARRSRSRHPMVLWSLEVEKRRGKRIAIVALARKLGAILFAIWRDGTFYNPTDRAPLLPSGAMD
jgi:transposase